MVGLGAVWAGPEQEQGDAMEIQDYRLIFPVEADKEEEEWTRQQEEHACLRCDGSGDLGTGRIVYQAVDGGRVFQLPVECPNCKGIGQV